ncbi:hypothetical protein GSI_00941 [Ganoderma sinense ZZ0214-1]|uniref:DUF6534 domain-containing protein n=1 Tax=Ganoderma sinense ZZ0214-1 TaxID=1077348 RepID=A0A2G8SUJ7_9APHY|nr:hypothetical protein GSI_00941 [Ganoderma sinense ZZ0214-1]
MSILPLPAPLELFSLSGHGPSPTLDETFGAVLVGTFLSLMLYGVTLHQAFRYHALYPSDRSLLKFASVIMQILPLSNVPYGELPSMHIVTPYANSIAIRDRSLQILPVLTGSVIGISQAFFARRAYVFGKQYRTWVSWAIAFLLGSFAFCIVATIVEILLTNRGFSAFVPDTWIIAVASAMAVCADFILTTVLIIALRQSRSGVAQLCPGSSFSDLLAGLLTSVSMLILFIFVVLRPADLVYTAISLVSTKLYANALLAALNSRQSLRDQTYHADQSSLEIQTLGAQLQGLPRRAFDQPVASGPPELPKRPRGSHGMETMGGRECPWSEGAISPGPEGLYSDSESASTLWEAKSLRDTSSIATAV